MNCQGATERLTAYLDGDLDPTTTSAVRGHLRSCEACNAAATEHARLRDALTSLPPVEPPPALWAGVMAQLGAAEVADSRRSRLGLWWQRWMPRLVPVAGVAAAAVVAIGVKTLIDRGDGDAMRVEPVAHVEPAPVSRPDPAPVPPPAPVVPKVDVDVAEDLAGDAARADRAYAATVDDLLALAEDARATWSPTQAQQFAARVTVLRGAVAAAADPHARARAWQALIDYTQRAVVGVRIAEAR